jgi:hypothetical protein
MCVCVCGGGANVAVQLRTLHLPGLAAIGSHHTSSSCSRNHAIKRSVPDMVKTLVTCQCRACDSRPAAPVQSLKPQVKHLASNGTIVCALRLTVHLLPLTSQQNASGSWSSDTIVEASLATPEVHVWPAQVCMRQAAGCQENVSSGLFTGPSSATACV